MCVLLVLFTIILSDPPRKRSQNIMSIDPSRIQLVLPPGGFPTCTVGVPNHRDATILGARGWAVGKGEKC